MHHLATPFPSPLVPPPCSVPFATHVVSHVGLNPGLRLSCILCSLSRHFLSNICIMSPDSPSYAAFENHCQLNVASHVGLNPAPRPSCILFQERSDFSLQSQNSSPNQTCCFLYPLISNNTVTPPISKLPIVRASSVQT